MRAQRGKRARTMVPATLCARLPAHVTLQADAGGRVTVRVDGGAVGLGTLSPGAVERAQGLREGLRLAAFASGRRSSDQEIDRLVRRLAR